MITIALGECNECSDVENVPIVNPQREQLQEMIVDKIEGVVNTH